MTTIRAAVLYGPRGLRVEHVALEPPAPDEIRVDLRAAGVCHTDYERYTGDSGDSYPIVLGHEGAGVVEAVGDRVTGIEPGQHVVLTVTTYCGSCTACDRGEPFLCENDGPAHDGTLLDGCRCRLLDCRRGTGRSVAVFGCGGVGTSASLPNATSSPAGRPSWAASPARFVPTRTFPGTLDCTRRGTSTSTRSSRTGTR